MYSTKMYYNENAEVLELKIHTDHGSFNKSMKFVK